MIAGNKTASYQDTTLVRGSTVNESVVAPMSNGGTVSAATDSVSTPDGGQKKVGGILGIFIGLLVLYFAWGIVSTKSANVSKELKPRNVAANLHNFIVIGLGAALAFQIFKLITTKMANVQNKFIANIGAYLGTVLIP